MAQNFKPRKVLRVPLLKKKKCLCESTCFAVTNLELTFSHILSLLSLNSVTSITSTETPRMLSKQNNSTHNSLLSSQITLPELDRIACTEDFFYTEMSIAPRGKRYFIRSLPVAILLRELALRRCIYSYGSIFKIRQSKNLSIQI